MHHASTAGMALLLVLGMIVLITVLVVGFLFTAGTQRKATASYQYTVEARQLSDTAVNLVQAQINDATTQKDSTTQAPKAWASQPGAVRVFNASGNLERIYRLFSSTSLTGTASEDLANDVPPTDWSDFPATWVDINEPGSFTDSSGSKQLAFPILDPRNPSDLAQPLAMPGFSLNSPPGATATQPAPMPVRWLYILQDGKIVSPSAGSDGSNVTVAGASGTNPIVGRVAFWTDDETCKVNLNTAGGDDGGANSMTAVAAKTFWDTPRFYTEQERDMARFQPAKGEFQRYSGHPATVALRPILSALGISSADSATFFNILPRFDFGGSQGATIATSGPVAMKSSRLYSSPGELLYTKDGSDQNITRQQAETARFFLTSRSRAPELTLFGTPRVAIWPMSHNATDPNTTDPTSPNPYRTPIDNLISFCSTVNGNQYHFTRKDPTSTTADIKDLPRNVTLLKYLDRMTKAEIPGFGGNFDTKYPDDRRQILTQIFDYIRSSNLRDSTLAVGSTTTVKHYVPTPSSSAQGGYGQVAPITLSQTGTPDLDWNTQGFGRFPRINEAAIIFVGMGSGTSGATPPDAIRVYPEQIVPSNQPDVVTRQDGGGVDYPAYGGIDGNGTPPNNTTAVQAFFVLSFFDPNQGWCALNPGLTIKVDGLDQLTLNGDSLGMKNSATIYYGYPGFNLPSTSEALTTGGIYDIRAMFSERRNGVKPTNFPFYSFIVPVPNTASAMTVGAADLTVSIYAGYPTNYWTNSPGPLDPDKLVQTYTLKYPQTVIPVPAVETSATYSLPTRRFGSATSDRGGDRALINWVIKGVTVQYESSLIYFTLVSSKDSVLSLIPSEKYADYRQLAVQSVPDDAFVPHPTNNFCSLASGFQRPFTENSSFGNLTGAIYTSPTKKGLPIIPATAGVTGVKAGLGTAPGDWDNGLSTNADGAFINKADEGNISALDRTPPNNVPYFNDYQTQKAPGPSYFSPNRQMPSPGMFGSLPTGVKSEKPWQTLLFRPGAGGHKGNDSPKDHLLLDLFWMPVAEPYPISEPLSTAGKVNLNYQIVPFTYISRSTALQAVLASQRVAKVSKSLALTYKLYGANNPNFRLPLNLSDSDGTLRQFKEKFGKWEIYKSATEICDIFLVPEGSKWTSDAEALSEWYGDDFALVGDNTRERPYTYILPRVTTKSNVFTVYTRVQVLKNPLPADQQNQWIEGRGKIVGEYRGSTTLERFIDTSDSTLPDPAADSSISSLDTFYKWRVLETAQFAP